MMQRMVDKPATAANTDDFVGAEEERELALLAQFMSHNSVASLAKAIAAHFGGSMRAADLIAAAGLRPRASEN
jgi:hypothetical protein